MFLSKDVEAVSFCESLHLRTPLIATDVAGRGLDVQAPACDGN